MTTYTVTFTVETKRPLGPCGEAELEDIIEEILDGHREGGLPDKYDVTNVTVNGADNPSSAKSPCGCLDACRYPCRDDEFCRRGAEREAAKPANVGRP